MEKRRDGVGVTSCGRLPDLTHYNTIDGQRVTIPPVARRDSTVTVFTEADVSWLAEAMRDARARLAAYRSEVAAGANPVYAARLGPAELAMKEADARFGPDGAGFLDALNAGELWDDFWRAMFCVFGLRAQRPTRIEGAVQNHIITLLRKLPSARRQHILAQAFFPAMRKPRQWEGFHALVIEELERPDADLRAWEVGVGKISSIEDIDDKVLIEIARSFGARTGQFAAFTAHVSDADKDKPPLQIKTASTPGTRPADRAEALAVLEDFPVSNTYGPGVIVKSEANLYLTQAFHATMRKIMPGIPQGHLMNLALSTMPYGPTWPRVDFASFPRNSVWPYIASHLDIVDRALRGERLPWEPFMEPMKALNALAFLPKPPACLVPVLERTARGGTAAQKKAAAKLLK